SSLGGKQRATIGRRTQRNRGDEGAPLLLGTGEVRGRRWPCPVVCKEEGKLGRRAWKRQQRFLVGTSTEELDGVIGGTIRGEIQHGEWSRVTTDRFGGFSVNFGTFPSLLEVVRIWVEVAGVSPTATSSPEKKGDPSAMIES
ncbi:hypothetical protein LINGRAHAP2_LOCUS4456, partial [Linum grandiflorum]